MKKKILFIIPITIILITVIIGILYLVTDLFKPTSKLFWKYFGQADSIISNLPENEIYVQNEFKKNNSYITNGELTLMLKQGTNSSKQLNATTITRHDSNNNKTFAEATLKNGDLDIFDVSYVNSGDIYAIKCDEVTPNYVGIQNKELKKLAINYKSNYSDFIPNEVGYINFLNLADKQNEQIFKKYFSIITNNIPENQYSSSKEKIQIEGTTYDTNAYNVIISGDNTKKIMLDFLDTVKSDNEMLSLVATYIDTSDISAKVDKLKSQIEKFGTIENINIKVYESRGNTIKIELNIHDIVEATLENNNDKIQLTINLNDGIFNKNYDEEESNNEIIDLNKYEANVIELNTKVVLIKENTDNKEIYKINVVPNINDEKNNIYIETQFSNIQNNSFNNLYILTINKYENEKENSTTITYNTNTTKTNEVGNIIELTNENTIIANNYDPNQFEPFINSWIQIFKDKLKDKLETLGFDN